MKKRRDMLRSIVWSNVCSTANFTCASGVLNEANPSNRHSTQAHAHFELNAAALCDNPTPPQSSTKRPFPLFQPRFFELDRTNSKSLVSMTTTHNGQVRNDERAVALALRLQVRPPFYLHQTYRGPGEGGNDREIRVIPLNCGQCRQCCGRQLNE